MMSSLWKTIRLNKLYIEKVSLWKYKKMNLQSLCSSLILKVMIYVIEIGMLDISSFFKNAVFLVLGKEESKQGAWRERKARVNAGNKSVILGW